MKTNHFFDLLIFVAVSLMSYAVSVMAQTTVVKGRLLDVEGKPSQYGLVGIAASANANEDDVVSCDGKGNYSVTLSKPGVQFLMYSIPSHHCLKIPVRNDRNKQLTIDVVLAPYKYKSNFDDLGIAGSFNGYNFQAAEKMTRHEDGTYSYEIKSDQKEIEYQLVGIEEGNRTINAPGSAEYKPDRSGDYQSIVRPVAGKALVVFDPKELLTKEAESKVSISGDPEVKKIYEAFDEYSRISDDAYKKRTAARETNMNLQNFQYDRGTYFNDLLGRIDAEQNRESKDVLKLLYVAFAQLRPKEYSNEKAKSFFESTPPESFAWDIIPSAFYSFHIVMPQVTWSDVEEKFLKNTTCRTIMIFIVGNRLVNAKFSHDEEKLKELHALIARDYKDVKELQVLLKRFPVESRIKVGAELPDYEVVSITNPGEIYSKKSMKGRIYLIDFWATWCGPCVGEMENLHKAYDKYHEKGFDIISLSNDVKPEDVAKFRNGKWKMPWKNVFLDRTIREKITKDFEIIGIPKPILVSGEGKILALDNDLRGEKLEQLLSNYFK